MQFVVLGDLHYGTFENPAQAAIRDRVYSAFFRQAASHKADLVFAIGDTTNLGTEQELKAQDKLAASCGIALTRTTGNHDSDSMEKAELAPFYLGANSSAAKDEIYTSFDLDPVRFVLLDTARVKMSHINYGGIVSATQLAWLHNEVQRFNAAASPRYLMVLGHHPLVNTTHRSNEEWLNIENSAEVQGIFAQVKRTPALYFNGHNHTNSLVATADGQWYFVQSGAPLECLGYRLVTVDEHGVKVETIDFDLTDPQLMADLIATRRGFEDVNDHHPPEFYYGSAADREIFIPA